MEYGVEELINHYEIGKEMGYLDGALMAYKDIQTAIGLGHGLDIVELSYLIQGSIKRYEELLEKLND